MKKDSFVHLHVHTEYSMLDGAAKIRNSLEYVKQMGQDAMAITDHGYLFGAYEFVQTANSVGVKPIVGIEAYLAPESRTVRGELPFKGVTPPQRYSHMTLLSENNTGLSNLFRLSSLASQEGYYYKPRMDRELLSKYSEGLIGTSGCFGGEVKQLLKYGFEKEALAAAAEFKDIFGPDNFFIEVMDHGIDEENKLTPQLIKIARDLNLPIVATNDSHFTYPSQKTAHDALLCLQTGAKIKDEKRMRFDGEGYHIKTSEEMRELWRDLPEACDNTLLIAERCDVSFEHRDDVVPKFPVPDGHTEQSFLEEETQRGLRNRYPTITPEIEERARYELEVIKNMGYPGYFLVVSDFIRWAKRQRIRIGPGRGSGPGSIVAYALDITELDPIRHKLMFERFLNPDRISMPDMDIDIQEDRREEVIDYCVRKYGSENVSQIVTYGTLKGKSSLKSAARVLDKPISLANALSKAYPAAHQGKEVPLSAMTSPSDPHYKETGELRSFYDTNPDAKEVIDLALGFEGLKSQWGIHAAGVVLCDKPLIDVIPVLKSERDGSIVTQFDMGAVEELGLLKMDFLGLRNLTILEDALATIKKRTGKEIVLEDLPLEDEKTFRLFAKGYTLGVFQLDSPDIRKLLRRMKPTSFEDISAVLALYRPGPMGVNAHNKYADRKNGREQVDYIHPELTEALEPILGETHGLIVFQEQVMLIAQRLAGYTLPQADLLRKAMGKKKKEVLDEQKPAFLSGMLERGFSKEAFDQVWETIIPFSDYAFNRAHTAAYGLISYWTGYLKANYPAEYMSALLTSFKDDLPKTAQYLSECRRMGVKTLPPNINESVYNYTVNQDGDIVYGLGAIKGIGQGPVEGIQKSRDEHGPYKSLTDLFYRTDLTKRHVEPLILSGALDGFGYSRAGMMESFQPILNQAKIRAQEERHGIRDLFSLLQRGKENSIDITDPDIPAVAWENRDQLEKERSVIGVYLSGHPLNGYSKAIEDASTHEWAELPDLADRAEIIVGGLITDVAHRISKRGNPWCSMNLVSMDGIVEMRCFDKNLLSNKQELFASGKIVMLKASINNEDGTSVSLIVNNIKQMLVRDEDLEDIVPIRLQISQDQMRPELAQELKETLASFRGNYPVYMEIKETGKEFDLQVKVSNQDSLKRRLLTLLGNDCIKSGLGE